MSAVRTVSQIAANVFKESVRDKVLYGLVLFAVLLIGASLLLGELTAGQEIKIIKDLGLAAISLFGLFIAVFIGTGLVSKEVERRSIYSLLTKPMTRSQFILGKYLGLVLTLTVNIAIMTAALYLVLAVNDWRTVPELKAAWEAPAIDPALMKASLLILAELSIVTAVALLFSTFSGPILSAAFTVGLAIVGQFNADLKNFESVVNSAPVVWTARALYYLLPNLAPFDVKAQVVHALPVPLDYLAWTIGYGAVYVTVLLLGATLIFSRRDFK
jgi:ABC-type transport system involved in multi-copper enzyme maturation permease subunit